MSQPIPFRTLRSNAILLVRSTQRSSVTLGIRRVFDDESGPGTQSVLEAQILGITASRNPFDLSKPVTVKLADLAGDLTVNRAREFAATSLNVIRRDCAMLIVQGDKAAILRVASATFEN